MSVEAIYDYNRVLHFQKASSDKLYIVRIELPDESGDEYIVNAYYGKRGATLKIAPQGVCGSLVEAQSVMREVARKKTSKRKDPYQDISDKSYTGPVTYDSVEEYLTIPKGGEIKKNSKKGIVKPKKDYDTEFVVLCINNSGLEDHFDKDMEYIAKNSKEGDEFYEVEDRYGEMITSDNKRFEVVEEISEKV